MALYEAVFTTRQDLIANDIDNLSDKLSKIIVDFKGKVVSKEYWGLRDLPFKVKKNIRGHFIFLNIDSSYEAIKELKRVMGYNEDIIRNDIFKVDHHTKKSPLMLCVNAKDYKAEKSEPAKTEFDDIIDKITISQ